MSIFYVSDMDSYLLAVPQHGKSEQGRSQLCFGKTRVSVDTFGKARVRVNIYVNVIRQ